jgi:ribonuclease T2
MPSGRLVGGQWRAHGSCTGLSQAQYFRQLRKAWDKIRIPDKFQELTLRREYSTPVIEHAFVEANPGMDENGISLSCQRGLLREVRICMTKDLEFRRCDELERKACKGYGLRIPPAREK